MSVEYIYLKEMEIDDMKKNMIPGLAVHMMQFFQARVQNGGCFSQDAGISNFFIKSHQCSPQQSRKSNSCFKYEKRFLIEAYLFGKEGQAKITKARHLA